MLRVSNKHGRLDFLRAISHDNKPAMRDFRVIHAFPIGLHPVVIVGY